VVIGCFQLISENSTKTQVTLYCFTPLNGCTEISTITTNFMIVKKPLRSWTKEEKERMLLDIKGIGVVAGCRKHNIAPSQYYDWAERYNTLGLEGLESKQGKSDRKELNRLRRDLALAKEVIADKELELKLLSELLKKKISEWNKGGK
jgi:transposase-like protein